MGVWTDLLKGAFKFFARDTISTTSASAPSASTSAPNTTSEELVNHTPAITHSLATAALNRTLYENLEEIMDIERYGSKLKLLRVTAYVLKFIRLLRGDGGAVKSKELKAEDLNFAEVTWIRGVQAHSFGTERQNLLHGYERSKHVKQFNLYLDEDKIIRCGGRINNADTTEESKNLVLLPSRHRYTELLIRDDMIMFTTMVSERH